VRIGSFALAKKYSANNGISSRRSRSAGISMTYSAMRKKSSGRNVSEFNRSRGLSEVADSTRISTGRTSSFEPPTGLTRLTSSSVSSITWTLSAAVEISSRNSVPLSASVTIPVCSRPAPVNAPRTWPNNWLAASSGTNAPTFVRRKVSPQRRG